MNISPSKNQAKPAGKPGVSSKGSDSNRTITERPVVKDTVDISSEGKSHPSPEKSTEFVDTLKATYQSVAEIDPQAAELMLDSEYDFSLRDLEKSREDYGEAAARRTELLATQGALLDGEEKDRLNEFADSKLKLEQEKIETATQEYLDLLSTSTFEEHLQGLNPQEQVDFFGDIADNLPASGKGRDWLAGFTDALSEMGKGKDSDHAIANLATELREQLQGRSLEEFDSSLGSILGMDLALRPEGNGERLTSVAEALGIPRENVDALLSGEADSESLGTFGSTVATTSSLFDAATGMAKSDRTLRSLRKVAGSIPGNEELLTLTEKSLSLLGKGVRGAGKLLGGAGNLFSLASIAENVRDGRLDEAGAEVAGMVGGALVASFTGPGAIAGTTLIGLSLAYSGLKESKSNADFVFDAMEHTFGSDAMLQRKSAALMFAPSNALGMLNELKPDDLTLKEYFDQELAKYGEGVDGLHFADSYWKQIQAEYHQTVRP